MSITRKRYRLAGAQFRSVLHVDSNFAVGVDEDTIILADATAGAITIDLPPAANAFDRLTDTGMVLKVKRLNGGANAVTLDGAGAETIDGAATLALGSQYAVATIVSDGTAWHRIGS